MKYLCLAGVLVFGLWIGVCSAEENTGKKLKEIDVGETETAVEDEGYGVDQESQTLPGGIYDENTGLPNVVESDKTGELE